MLQEYFIKLQKMFTNFMTCFSAQDEEIWRITSSMEEHKSKIADWDLGAGIYIDFYVLRSSLQEEDSMSESV